MKEFKFSFLILTLALLFSCGTDDNGHSDIDTCIQGFDQQAMFENIADNLIIPAYNDLKSQIGLLQSVATLFVDDPTPELLESLQALLNTAYLSWQSAAPYEFGPAESVFLRNSLNNFPTNIGQIENNISNGSWNFDQPDNFDKGFPALDYLLFGVGENNTEILGYYKNGPDAPKRLDYLTALIADMKTRVDQTATEWESYRATFVANTGTADGSALSQLVNNLNHHYELIKREKIGFPSGVLTSGFSNPEAVEAYYSGQSLSLTKAALETTEQLFKGLNGQGLDDYLNKVDAQKNGIPLATAIDNQFTQIYQSLDLLSDPLSENIEDNPAEVTAAYQQISDMVVLLKTDLPSVLCISITYIDNPSDSD